MYEDNGAEHSKFEMSLNTHLVTLLMVPGITVLPWSQNIAEAYNKLCGGCKASKKISSRELLVSSSTCKELSLNFFLTTNKVNRLNNQQCFLGPLERGGHRANHGFQDWRDRLIQAIIAHWSRDLGA